MLMKNSGIGLLLVLCLLLPCAADAREVTLLYTNDIESVYEPVEAFWRDDMQAIGGMARLSSLVSRLRSEAEVSFLLDAGDMFTGSLSKATGGQLVFDIYSTMGYDAGNLGNHEFEYGWQVLQNVMQRARFPVLNANIYHTGTDIPFARQYAILEREDVRIGVIGLMGVDAFVNTMMKSNREGLSVRPPVEVTQALVDQLRPEVDLVILLTHQNRTAPMQTDKEADPSVARGYDEDYALAGAVTGVDMIIGGHSDNGLPHPVQHPVTGTWIGMTYGQGTHLGYVRFSLDGDKPELTSAKLIPVNADLLPEDQRITRLISSARSRHPDLTRVVGTLTRQAARQYNRESDLGNLLADMLREYADADIGLVPAGAIRTDLQAGEVTVEEVLNVFPFTDTVALVTLNGVELKSLLEKGLSLDYGMAQFSGVTITFDGSAPRGERLIHATVGGKPLQDRGVYRVATVSFTATGGEGYTMMEVAPKAISDVQVADVFIRAFEQTGAVNVPVAGRLVNLAD